MVGRQFLDLRNGGRDRVDHQVAFSQCFLEIGDRINQEAIFRHSFRNLAGLVLGAVHQYRCEAQLGCRHRRCPAGSTATNDQGLGLGGESPAEAHQEELMDLDAEIAAIFLDEFFDDTGIIGFSDSDDYPGEVGVVRGDTFRSLDQKVGSAYPGRGPADETFAQFRKLLHPGVCLLLERGGHVDGGILLDESIPGGFEIASFDQVV